MNEQKLEALVRQVMAELGGERASTSSGVATKERTDTAPASSASAGPAPTGSAIRPSETYTVDDGVIPDIREVDYRTTLRVKDPENPEAYLRLMRRTWARLGVGRSGPRYTTEAQLRFWADHAAAMDAVTTDVDQAVLDELGLFTVQTTCRSKEQYLTDPVTGTRFDDAAIQELKSKCRMKPQVQVYAADGLSSTAVEANITELLPALEQGLKLNGLEMGTPFFVKYGRVRSMEPISEALGATVTCVLLGERPGLASSESLSAYLAHDARVGMSESSRTCVSNIHQGGTNPVEAGAHLADVIHEMIKQKTSNSRVGCAARRRWPARRSTWPATKRASSTAPTCSSTTPTRRCDIGPPGRLTSN